MWLDPLVLIKSQRYFLRLYYKRQYMRKWGAWLSSCISFASVPFYIPGFSLLIPVYVFFFSLLGSALRLISLAQLQYTRKLETYSVCNRLSSGSYVILCPYLEFLQKKKIAPGFILKVLPVVRWKCRFHWLCCSMCIWVQNHVSDICSFDNYHRFARIQLHLSRSCWRKRDWVRCLLCLITLLVIFHVLYVWCLICAIV